MASPAFRSLQIRKTVAQVNPVLLQEGMHLGSGVIAEQRFSCAVEILFTRYASRATASKQHGEVLAGAGQTGGKLLGNIERTCMISSLAEMEMGRAKPLRIKDLGGVIQRLSISVVD